MSQSSIEKDLIAEILHLREQLDEAHETLYAIHQGEVDALVVSTPQGPQVYTLSGAEKPYRLLVEEMNEGAVILSDDNTILYCNKGFAKMVNHPIDTLFGSNIQSIIALPHLKKFQKLLSLGRTGKGPKSKEVTLQANGGHLVATQMSVNSVLIDDTKKTFLVTTDLSHTMEDELKHYTSSLEKEIFQRKKAEDALKQSEQLYRMLFENTEYAFIIFEPLFDKDDKRGDFLILQANKALEQQTGLKTSELIGKRIKEILPNIEPVWITTITDVVKKGKSIHNEGYNKDTNRWYDVYFLPYGKSQVAALFTDITERKDLEIQLHEKERLAIIGQTAGMVGHDIRNPLQAIIGDLYLLNEAIETIPKDEDKTNSKEIIEGIEENINYINKIVADLQDYSRKIEPKLEEIDLKEAVENVLLAIDIPKNITTFSFVEPNTKVITDSIYIRRILANLITNAIQAMPNGGKITIAVTYQNNSVKIVIKDTGQGMTKEIQEKLFTPLFTTKAKGQGFGLAVVKKFIEELGGTISFESKYNEGTKFTIIFPNK